MRAPAQGRGWGAFPRRSGLAPSSFRPLPTRLDFTARCGDAHGVFLPGLRNSPFGLRQSSPLQEHPARIRETWVQPDAKAMRQVVKPRGRP